MYEIAFDFETHLITPTCVTPRAVCMSYAFIDGSRVTACGVVSATVGLELLKRWLADGCTLIGANTAFDVAVSAFTSHREAVPLDAWFRAYAQDRVVDIQIDQKLLDGAVDKHERLFRYSLADLYAHWTGRHLPKQDTWRLRYAELEGVPVEQYPQEAYEYALRDAIATAEVRIAQRLADAGDVRVRNYRRVFSAAQLPTLLADSARQARKALALHLASAAMLYTDPQRVELLKQDVLDEQIAARDTCLTHGLVRREVRVVTKKYREILAEAIAHATGTSQAKRRANAIASDARLQWLSSDAYKSLTDAQLAPFVRDGLVKISYSRNVARAKAHYEHATGLPADGLDRDALSRVDDEALRAYGVYTRTQKRMSTDVALAEKATTGFIARYNTLRDNGRTSSGEGGNVQNMQRAIGFREVWVPPAGYLYSVCDYPAIELVTFGAICLRWFGWSDVARRINEGIDQHAVIGAALDGHPDPDGEGWRELKRRIKAGDVRAKELRTAGKGVNFGTKGKMGAERYADYAFTSYGVQVTVEEARRHIALHEKLTREMGPYTRMVTSFARYPGKRDTVYDLIHPLSLRPRAGLSFCDVHNYPFSGFAQDLAGEALWELTLACYGCSELGITDPLYGCRVALFVHDEIVLYVPDEQPRATLAAVRHAEIMKRVAERWATGVKVDTVATLQRELSKAAPDEPEFDENGHIKPFSIIEAVRHKPEKGWPKWLKRMSGV